MCFTARCEYVGFGNNQCWSFSFGWKRELGCGSHSTWVPNHYLGTDNCWNGASHKKCKEMSGACCNPSEQTDCDGILKKKKTSLKNTYVIKEKYRQFVDKRTFDKM